MRDGVRDRAAAAEPERVLVQLLANAFRFESVLAAIERLEHGGVRAHQRVVGEYAAEADRPRRCGRPMSVCTQSFRPQLVAPAAFGVARAGRHKRNFTDLHGGVVADVRERFR